MASSYDSVRPIACETPAEGGTQSYTSPTELDPKSDAVAVAGVHLIGPGAPATDKTVFADRSSGSLRLTDNVTQRLLSELVTSVSGGVNSHAGQLDAMHFLRDGPGEAWASGSYAVNSYSGCLLTKRTWYTVGGVPVISRNLAYNGLLVQSETLTIYNAAGVAVRQVVDTFSYSGVMRTGATRTWS